MKHLTKILAMCLVLALSLSIIPAAFAATVPTATIDTTKTGSIEIYKYDLSRANTDDTAAAMIDSYVSTGVRDTALEAVLDDGTANALGNGQTSYGYAVKGVEFSYLKVADICTYSENETVNGRQVHKDLILYKFKDTDSAALLSAIGLTNANAYPVTAAYAESGYHFFVSDTLIDALNAALAANATNVKNALEAYMRNQGSDSFAETDAHGHTSEDGLELGLYLIVETKVPEMVTDTTNPFFASLPMTSVNGTNANNGGQEWLYDIVLYPKNSTGIPSLEKTVRESVDDTGKNGGDPDDITDGYAHNATASQGDRVEYQIISKLPAITSDATTLSCYTFVDAISEGSGIAYDGNEAARPWNTENYEANNIVIEFFRDADCTDKITTWRENDAVEGTPAPKFQVVYGGSVGGSDNTMTITMTSLGLREINSSNAVYTAAGAVDRGYSNCYMRITYSGTLIDTGSQIYGDLGNDNTVVLTWQRSNMSYYDTLVDDCHVYTYALNLEKQFSDGAGDFSKVLFKIQNITDGYWIKGVQDDDGLFFVSDHVATEDEATEFTVELGDTPHALRLYGLEDDTYLITEIQTDNGYTLLKDGITVVITATDDANRPCGIYGSDVLGVLQNDPRYRTFDGYKQLAHNLLTASATVDGDAVEMQNGVWRDDVDSTNAIVPLTVINTRGPELPKTGDDGVWRYSVYGILLMVTAACMIVLISRKKKSSKQ